MTGPGGLDGRIDYVEIPGDEMGPLKAFYGGVFGWRFTDYGPDYSGFDGGLDGGLATDPGERTVAPLIVIRVVDPEAMLERVVAAGGSVTRPIFHFPGGRRFHFRDPAGNELAVWTTEEAPPAA
jgi:predicted enzyme related to lactoylglutathione lyase